MRALIALSLLACGETHVVPSTQIMIVVDADEMVRERLTELVVRIDGGTGDDRTSVERRFAEPRWPVRLAVVPKDGDATRPLEVEALALDGAGPFVRKLAITTFLQDRLLELRLFLEGPCVGVMCPIGQTCEGGMCRTATIDPSDLPPFLGADAGASDAGPSDTGVRDAAGGDASLASLTLSAGALRPDFTPGFTSFAADVPLLHHSLQVTAVPVDPLATVTVNGLPVDAMFVSPPIALRTLAPAANTIVIAVRSGTAMSSYTVQVSRAADLEFVTTVTPSPDSAAGDAFGWSIAQAGRTLAVGAPRSDAPRANAGSVYVFLDSRDGFTQHQHIVHPSPSADDRSFGWSVALSPDALTLFVAEVPQMGPGIIHRYTRAAVTAMFTHAGESAGIAGLGWSLAIDGTSLAAGRNPGSTAYVFPTTSTTATDTVPGDAASGMGQDIAISGDTVVAGASESGSNNGAIFTSTRVGARFGLPVRRDGSDLLGRFGWSVALRPPFDGEPMLLAVGSFGTGSNAGGVHLFEPVSPGAWTGGGRPFPRVVASDHFGWRVALSGDVLAATAPGVMMQRGALLAFVRSRGGTEFTAVGTALAPGAEPGDQLGGSWSRGLVIAGDRLFVSAPFAGRRAPDMFPLDPMTPVGQGRVYIYQ